MEKKGTNGMGIVSLVLGILAIAGSFIPVVNNASIIIGVIGIIFGIIGLLKNKPKGLAIAGLVISLLAVIISFALQASWGKELDNTSKELDQSIKDGDGTNTDQILKNDIDVKLGDFVVEAVDASGNRIMDDTVYVDGLATGQTQEFKIFEYVEDEKLEAMKNATFKIFSVSKY